MSEFDTMDDSDDWIPLNEHQDHHQSNAAVIERPQVVKNDSIVVLKPSTSNQGQKKTKSLEEIRGRHERNVILKTHLVDKPLSLMPVAFLRHFVHEIWNTRYSIRLGIFLLVLGSILHCLSLIFCIKGFMTAGFYLVMIGLSSYAFLYGFYGVNTLSKMDADSTISAVLDHLTGRVIRNVVIFVVHVLPFLAQAWSYSYLSQTTVASSTLFACFSLFLFEVAILLHLNVNIVTISSGSHSWFLIKDGACHVGKYILTTKGPTSLFDARLHAWIYLYALATISSCISIRRNGFGDAIFLLAPLLISSGILILATSRYDEYGNDILIPLIRCICRQALADVLKHVGDNVSGNDMFRLTMLRWIVDYWATASPNKTDSASAQDDRIPLHLSTKTKDDAEIKNNTCFETTHTEPSTEGSNNNMNSSNFNGNYDLEWKNLCAMLGMTTSQMFSEVSTDGHHIRHENKSVSNIRFIIDSLNVDDRARPIVESYKHMVNQSRISRELSIILAIVSRCPGLASVLWLLISFSTRVGYCTLLLVPVIALEFTRVVTWLNSCQRAYPNRADSNDDELRSYFQLVPRNMPSMDILLSKDDISAANHGTTLQIWYNIESSVSALESGLVAVKCVQTATVATDLAFNVMSLSKYATELHSVGFTQGLFTVLLDVFLFHMDSTEDTNKRPHLTNRTKISSTAAAIVDNTNMIKKNLSDLLDSDKDGRNILSPVVCQTQKIFSSFRAPIRDANGTNTKEDKNDTGDDIDKFQSPQVNDVQEVVSDDIGPSTSVLPHRETLVTLPNDLELHQDINGSYDNNDDEEDDASWEDLSDHLDSSKANESQTDRNDINETPTSTSVLSEDVRHIEIDSTRNEALKWVGIGSAILGTVMGGIALVNNVQNVKKDQGDSNSRNKRTSTITKIERLDDEDD